MFWIKTVQNKITDHHLQTIPSRFLFFAIAFFAMTIYTILIESLDSALNTNIIFEHYHVGPKVAHFFKNMGAVHMANNFTTAPTQHQIEEPLFELESKLNPVFLEHGELEVRCKYMRGMHLNCFYTGVIKEPKYYIQEITFNNSRPDVVPFHFDPIHKYKPPSSYSSSDSHSKLAAYFFIFENLPGQIYRYPTLQSIYQTPEFKNIRDRVSVMTQTVISWSYISNYLFWTITCFFSVTHLMMMVTRVGITYADMKLGVTGTNHAKFLERLQTFSALLALFTIVCYVVHRLIVLLNGVAQSFALGSISAGITFNTTKTTTEGVSVLDYLFGLLALIWLSIAFYGITFKDNLFALQTIDRQAIDGCTAPDLQITRERETRRDFRASLCSEVSDNIV